jgi:hypothetical protein
MMSEWRCVPLAILVLMSVGAVAWPTAVGTAPPATELPVEAEKRIVKRSVQSDGSLKIEYADGTTKVLPKSALGESAAPPPLAGEPEIPKGPRGKPELPVPAAPHPLASSAPTLNKYSQAMQEYYEYQIAGFRHRQRVFAWQLLSSRIIFTVVIVLVFAGIGFAAMQFYVGLKRSSTSDAPPRSDITELEASLKGIRVSSPVLGVVILTLSLAFFYLYLVYVYPISEIF